MRRGCQNLRKRWKTRWQAGFDLYIQGPVTEDTDLYTGMIIQWPHLCKMAPCVPRGGLWVLPAPGQLRGSQIIYREAAWLRRRPEPVFLSGKWS